MPEALGIDTSLHSGVQEDTLWSSAGALGQGDRSGLDRSAFPGSHQQLLVLQALGFFEF